MNKIIISLALLVASADATADNPLSCTLGVLQDLGWSIEKTSGEPGVLNTDTCASSSSPIFTYNDITESNLDILKRSEAALADTATRCLVNRRYKTAASQAVGKLTANTEFTFPLKAPDPRDPFLPPAENWIPSSKRGYDIPLNSISEGVNALYEKPFVAECATAIQIAQLAVLTEHYGPFTDAMLDPSDIGIGIWREYAKNPSIAAKTPLLIDSSRRKYPLKALAELGKGAFYGQTGYIRSVKSEEFIDSIDNIGQNFLIVDISDAAVTALQSRDKPLREINSISHRAWKRYNKLLSKGGDKKFLSSALRIELEASDPFFSDVDVYVHPLKVKSFAAHLERQFLFNPRTPFEFEIYEDYQSGYFHERYVNYRLNQCTGQSYCRKINRK
ncbi:hypothetical protein AB833_31890, partial [Chromatiales bacterium (ex Bugula neritina AB1)]